MSPHQKELLCDLERNSRYDITDECVVKALARRGLARRVVPRFGHTAFRHHWEITDEGRKVAAELRASA